MLTFTEIIYSLRYNTLITEIWNVRLFKLPNQELSMLYGGPTLNYGRQLSLYFPHMLRVNMTNLQSSDLEGEIRLICRTSELQGERILIRRT